MLATGPRVLNSASPMLFSMDHARFCRGVVFRGVPGMNNVIIGAVHTLCPCCAKTPPVPAHLRPKIQSAEKHRIKTLFAKYGLHCTRPASSCAWTRFFGGLFVFFFHGILAKEKHIVNADGQKKVAPTKGPLWEVVDRKSPPPPVATISPQVDTITPYGVICCYLWGGGGLISPVFGVWGCNL